MPEQPPALTPIRRCVPGPSAARSFAMWSWASGVIVITYDDVSVGAASFRWTRAGSSVAPAGALAGDD